MAEGEETPEKGRGNEQPLSEDDNMSLSRGDPAGGQNTSQAQRVSTTGSSDMQVRPGLGALPQAQPYQGYLLAQAPFGTAQPMPQQPMPQQPMPQRPMPRQPWRHQSMPQQPTPQQPMPHRPMPQQPMPQQPMPQRPMLQQPLPRSPWRHQSLPPQSWPQQYLPLYSMPGNPSLQFSGLPPPQPSLANPQPPHMQPGRHGGYANQVIYQDGSAYYTPSNVASTAYGVGPLQARAYPQLPNQNSSEGGPQAGTPANTYFSMGPGNAGNGITTVYSNQVPANSAPSQGPEPVYFGTDVPRVTTPEAENLRNVLPSMRDEPILHLRITLLASRITARQRGGQPYTGLPGVTAEDIQEFRVQYRSMPVFTWPRELRVADDLVQTTLQAMRLLGLSLAALWQRRRLTGSGQSALGTHSAQLPGTTQPDDDGHVPEYLLDQFMEILELSGEQEALRFLRESKATAAQQSRRRDRARRKRRNAMMGRGDESRMGGRDRVIDDDLSAFGITRIQNAGGQITVAGSSRQRENVNSSPAMNRTIEIHIDDDLVGAAESSTPVEKFRRLMESSPTRKKPKKKKEG